MVAVLVFRAAYPRAAYCEDECAAANDANRDALTAYKAAINSANASMKNYADTLAKSAKALRAYEHAVATCEKCQPFSCCQGGGSYGQSSGGGLLQFLQLGAVGAVIGALLAAWFNTRSSKKEVALSLLDQYASDWSGKIFEARKVTVDDECNWLVEPGQLKKVTDAGDWIEIVSAAYRSRIASNALLDTLGLKGLVQDFRRDVCGMKNKGRERAVNDDQKALAKDLDTHFDGWTHIREIEKGLTLRDRARNLWKG
ncbi:MAG TPA: hypothetical protein VNE82_16260 [Candidatus Binataceae bacterium]|nr:hypothetical protein [Candidatus Binataceae bacterium]